jgi:deoxyribonuclease V
MRMAPRSEAEAIALQLALREQVRTDAGLARTPRLVAGLDAAYAVGSDVVAGAVVVLDMEDLSVVDSATVTAVAEFPYVPGLLAFREIPVLTRAMEKLTARPDVLVCDGYGIAHPRRFGLASHLGVITGLPSLGVGKTAFVGTHAEPGPERGDRAELVDAGEVVGGVLRTQRNVKPVFVSPGHLIDVAGACDLVLRLAPRYRLPETTRHADHLSRAALAAVSGLADPESCI